MSRRVRSAALLAAASLWAVGCTAGGPDEGAALEAIPSPALDAVEPHVRQRIESALASLPAQAAGPYGDAARVLHAHRFVAAAAACYRNAARLDPEDPRWPYLLGRLHFEEHRPADAFASFETVLALRPDHVPTRILLARMALESGDLDEAERRLERLAAVAPESPPLLFLRGKLALERKRYERAAEELERTLARSPESSAARYPLGLAYRALGRIDDAARQFALRGEVEPPFEDPWMQEVVATTGGARIRQLRGTQLFERGQYAEARAEFEAALAADPQSAVAWTNLALAQIRLGEDERALESLRSALAVAPDDPFANYNLGTLLAARGEDERALVFFRATLAREPGHVPALTNLGNALCRLDRCGEALEPYTRALERQPQSPELRVARARALGALDRWDEVREELETAHAERPGEPLFRVHLARVLAAAPDDSLRDGKRAVRLARPLLQDEPTLEALETFAMVAAENGFFDEAVRVQSNVEAALREADDPRGRTAAARLALYRAGQPCRSPWGGS